MEQDILENLLELELEERLDIPGIDVGMATERRLVVGFVLGKDECMQWELTKMIEMLSLST